MNILQGAQLPIDSDAKIEVSWKDGTVESKAKKGKNGAIAVSGPIFQFSSVFVVGVFVKFFCFCLLWNSVERRTLRPSHSDVTNRHSRRNHLPQGW
jgi:hypothetical protein